MKSISTKKIEKRPLSFPIVAIGAANGGAQAFAEMLKALPLNTGMAYVYLQHLDGESDSDLGETFRQSTKLKVQDANESTLILPNHVYVVPPNRRMKLVDGKLKLSLGPVKPASHLPINDFFTSLANEYREKAIGVLLSGNTPDGSLGLKAIKAAGGITFAQDSTAKFNNMPKAAIADEVVDLVLSPGRIAEELGKLGLHQEQYEETLRQLSDETINDRDENLTTIIRQILRLTGVDFSHYKINTIKRRIVRRMLLHDLGNLDAYVLYLKNNAGEVQQLYHDLLINVTAFFRDGEACENLRKTILPRIISQKGPGQSIRIWVAGCSTGQEAYSLAMLTLDVLGEKASSTDVHIFATDLSESAVNKARLGIYTKDEVADVLPQQLSRFFNKIDGSYRIIRTIRDMCVFASHNVLKDPPFSRLDIVSCCNLMIYLEPVLQKKIMSTFHYSLNKGGYLVLGNSETIGAAANLFSQVDKETKIYAKKKDVSAKAFFEMTFKGPDADKEHRHPVLAKSKTEETDLDKVVDGVLLKKFTPPSVVVNGDLEILQFRGSTGLFLEPAPGKASLNLLKMARPGLAFELRNLVAKATKSGEAEQKCWKEPTKDGNRVKEICIEAIPVKYHADTIEKYFLVTFTEKEVEPASTFSSDDTKTDKVKQLEEELATLREDMRTILEEQEAANEELQSVNEEIVSSNEELQSINEELETSKEELESSNEELMTINQELQMRNEQLAEIQEYSEAIYTTIRESLLILDKNLRIKSANLMFYKTFRVTEEETEGRMLYEVGNHQWDIPQLRELLENIIPRNAQVTDYEVVHTFHRIGEKVMMVNARRLVRKLHGEHLILLAIEDITEYRHAQKMLIEAEEWFHKMADQSPMMLWVTNADKKMEFVNEAWLEYRDLSKEEVLGKSWLDEMHSEDLPEVEKSMTASFDRKKEFTLQYRIKKGKELKTILSKGKPNFAPDGRFLGFIGSCVEVPPQGIAVKS